MESVEKEDSQGMSKLTHPSGQILVFKRNPKKEVLMVRKFHAHNSYFSKNLRLKGSMLNHHMPWGYNGLFDGHGTVPSEVTIEQFEDIMKVYNNNEATDSLYPNLQDI